MITKKKSGMFRSEAVREAPLKGVDRSANIIFGARVIQFGKVNDDRPWQVDDATLDQVVLMGNAPRAGLKARYTHPSLSDDGLGSYLGRWTNFRRHNDSVVADLHISDTAFDSPRGDLGNYILDLAEHEPDMFGVSLATVVDEELMQTELDALPEIEGEERLAPLRFRRLYSADAVDTPAATREGLFASEIDERTLPEVATYLLDTYFAGCSKPDVMARFESFLGKYYHNEGIPDMTKPTDDLTAVAPPIEEVAETVEETVEETDEAAVEETTEDEATPPTEAAQELAADISLAEGQEYMKLFGERGAAWYLQGKTISECYSTQMAEAREANDQLAATNASLETKLAASLLATGEAEPLSADPIDAKARKKQAKLAEADKKGIAKPVAAWAAMYPEE